MLEKIVKKRRLITAVWLALALFMGVTAMVYGDIPQKGMVITLSLILPCFFYGITRLVFKILGKTATFKDVRIIALVILGASLFGFIAPNVDFVLYFPDFYAVTPMSALGTGIGVLDAVAKLMSKDKPNEE